jgi:hypothetical protein
MPSLEERVENLMPAMDECDEFMLARSSPSAFSAWQGRSIKFTQFDMRTKR